MASTDQQTHNPSVRKGATLLIISLGILLLILTYGVLIAASHTNLREGLLAGLINGVFLGTGVSIFYLLWCALVCIVSRNRWSSWRKPLLMLPPLLVFGSAVVSLIKDSPSAENAFRKYMEAPFPDRTENLRYYSRGGGITDRTTVWCFETTPEAVEKLMDEMNLESMRYWSPEDSGSFPCRWPFPEAPNLQRWKGSEYHEGRSSSSFRYLIIDKDRRLVYAAYSNI
jgi:hypothetical protein